MFDFAWTEIALIGVVALVAIGPKDLPVAIKTVAAMIKKARRMAAEFQTHVDDLVREADLHEVRDQINQIRNFDIRGEIEKAVDADGSIRSTLATNPLATSTSTLTPPTVEPSDTPAIVQGEPHDAAAEQSRNASDTRVIERPADTVIPAPDDYVAATADTPPAFIPPGTHRV